MNVNLLYRHFEVLHTNSEELRVNCPFCSGTDTKFHMYINPSKGVVHCFRCGWAGRADRFLALSLHIHITEVREKFFRGHKEHWTPPNYESAVARLRGVAAVDASVPIHLPKGYVPFTQDQPYDMIGRMALRYLEGRGFSLEAIMHYALGYSVAGNTLGRIIIPVDEAYWQARTVFSIGTKYINPSTAKQDSLFNADALRLHKVRIAEGAFSAMSLGKNAIAILGKKPTRQQLDRLRLASTQVYHVHLDADATDLAYVLAEQLHRAGKNVTVMEYKKGDPADGKRGPKVTIGFATLMRHKLEHAE